MPQKTVTLSLETFLDIDSIPKRMRSRFFDVCVQNFLLNWEYDWRCIEAILRENPEKAFKRREQIRNGEIEPEMLLRDRIPPSKMPPKPPRERIPLEDQIDAARKKGRIDDQGFYIEDAVWNEMSEEEREERRRLLNDL